MNHLASRYILLFLQALTDMRGFLELYFALCRLSARAANL